jgi:NAD(P)H-nitrite reductase large subunit
VTPHVDLAAAAGLAVGSGVVIDDRLATSDPDIFGAGDCIEHRGRTHGLWPACLDQARIVAVNVLGGDRRYGGDVPSCRLKVAGVHVLSVGETAARSDRDEEEIRFDEAGAGRYRKLVIRDGEIRGGMLIGHVDLADRVATAVAVRTRVAPIIDSLRAGDWTVLAG